MRELLRKGADPTIPGGGGLTPLAVAKARGYRGCIEALEVSKRESVCVYVCGREK